MAIELGLKFQFQKLVAPRFDNFIRIQEEPGAREEYLRLMLEGGRPIIYGNHQSHGDGWAMARAVEHLSSLAREAGVDFRGVVMPVASSVLTGHQGLPLKFMYKLCDPVFQAKGLFSLPYTREKDEMRYGLKRNLAELLNMGRAIRRGFGIGYFPEGSVQGGRHKNPLGFIFGGEIHGMIDVRDSAGLLGFYDLMSGVGNIRGGIFFLPIVINGSYRFFSADILIPTLELIRGLFADTSSPAVVTIERPMTNLRLIEELGEFWRDDPDQLTHFLMKQIAKALPPEARGIYSDSLNLVA